jgi:hypothetical protein
VGLERGPLSLVSTIEELLRIDSSGYGLESRETAVGIHCTDHVTPSIRKSGIRSAGIACLRAKATEFILIPFLLLH